MVMYAPTIDIDTVDIAEAQSVYMRCFGIKAICFDRDKHLGLSQDRGSYRIVRLQLTHAVDFTQDEADISYDKRQYLNILKYTNQRGNKHDWQQDIQEKRTITFNGKAAKYKPDSGSGVIKQRFKRIRYPFNKVLADIRVQQYKSKDQLQHNHDGQRAITNVALIIADKERKTEYDQQT